jgi:archaellum biogenesis protein FlaJ (TadC family)
VYVTLYARKEDKEMAPLQKRALYSLIIGLVLTAILITVLLIQGDITAFENNENLRLVLYAVLVGVPLIYLALVNSITYNSRKVDERDRLVIAKSGRAQWMAVIFTLAAWTITLTEVYHEQGNVPVAYLNLIFFSILIISTLAQSLGILLGYRSTNRDA